MAFQSISIRIKSQIPKVVYEVLLDPAPAMSLTLTIFLLSHPTGITLTVFDSSQPDQAHSHFRAFTPVFPLPIKLFP